MSHPRRRVNDDGTLEVFGANIEDDGLYACHVTTADGLAIYRFMLQVQGQRQLC